MTAIEKQMPRDSTVARRAGKTPSDPRHTKKRIRERRKKKSAVLHLLVHENLPDRLGAARSAARAAGTADAIEKSRKHLKTDNNWKTEKKKLDWIIRTTRKRASNARKYFRKGNGEAAMAEINRGKQEVLTEMAKSRKLFQGELAASLQTLERELMTGLALTDEMSVTTDDSVATPGAVSLPGQLRVLVCMMRWEAGDPVNDQARLEPVMDQVAEWFWETSYHQTQLDVTYAGNTVWQGNTPTTQAAEMAAAVQTCDPTVDFANIDVVVIYPSTVTPPGHGWAAYQPERQTTSEGVVQPDAYTSADCRETTSALKQNSSNMKSAPIISDMRAVSNAARTYFTRRMRRTAP